MLNNINTLKIFFEMPTREFNVREISRMTKISPPTASKVLEAMYKKNILKKRNERTLNLFKANIESLDYSDIKVYYNINKIRKSGLIKKLNLVYMKPTIILFGSASHGTDIENSDIDLLVLTEKKGDFKEIKMFEKKLNRSLQIFVVDKIHKIKNKHLINNMLNGITLQGELTWT